MVNVAPAAQGIRLSLCSSSDFPSTQGVAASITTPLRLASFPHGNRVRCAQDSFVFPCRALFVSLGILVVPHSNVIEDRLGKILALRIATTARGVPYD